MISLVNKFGKNKSYSRLDTAQTVDLIIALFIIILLAGLVDVALELAGSGLQTVQLIAIGSSTLAGRGCTGPPNRI